MAERSTPRYIWAEAPLDPAPSLSRDKIVEVAITIVDAEGLDALSMRRLGTELSVRPMSLYRYVPSKDDLLELINDAVLGEQRLPEKPSGDWRADLRLAATEQRAVALRHPWSVTTSIGRPAMGPNAVRVTEFAMAALDGFGLDMDTINGLVGMLRGYVFGNVAEDLAQAELTRRTGITDEQWEEIFIPWVERLLADGRHPMMARFIREADHWNDDRVFEFGVERILDGIAAALPSSA
ncbi:TetR/AcrR family transcriptional regulator [Amycolatopsis minnesotensis]|uniref:TetR/AcrR family transcriptional regulator C-terminal domain-containing protein n=1 Tax=Amycolatopsis minnesotensis TaxID=337894 RepID=A0ABP5BW24_9PSEU